MKKELLEALKAGKCIVVGTVENQEKFVAMMKEQGMDVDAAETMFKQGEGRPNRAYYHIDQMAVLEGRLMKMIKVIQPNCLVYSQPQGSVEEMVSHVKELYDGIDVLEYSGEEEIEMPKEVQEIDFVKELHDGKGLICGNKKEVLEALNFLQANGFVVKKVWEDVSKKEDQEFVLVKAFGFAAIFEEENQVLFATKADEDEDPEIDEFVSPEQLVK